MSQTRIVNPFRPGSGVFPPLLAGREFPTSVFEARASRAREGHPQHTALLGEWAIGKTTLLMSWRRARRAIGDAVVLSIAYPQSADAFLTGLVEPIEAELAVGESAPFEFEFGLELGVASARVRRPVRDPERDLQSALRRLAERQARNGRSALVFIDDVTMLPASGDVLLRLRAIALELYAADLPVTFVVAGASSMFSEVRAAHEPLVRFFEPLTLGALDAVAAGKAITAPLADTDVTFEPSVVDAIVELSGGRPYYLQKLAYHAYESAERGRVGHQEFDLAFERAFASISQEIFSGRWASMPSAERGVVLILAGSRVPVPSAVVETRAQSVGVKPPAARQALRRLTARGHVTRLANGGRGRYVVADALFRRFIVRHSHGD